CLQDYNTPYNF
nr:immunoglobulin light chain junction region [Macaca mulatta]